MPIPPSGLGLPGMRLPPGMRMGPLGPVPMGAPYMHAAETSGELHMLQSSCACCSQVAHVAVNP
jgi:hypothetical protein